MTHLVAANAQEGGEQIFSTNDSGRPIAFIYGSRTVGALCPGALQALAQMRQV